MTRLFGLMLFLLAPALMVACTSNPRVQSDYDDNLDFSLYRTFDFSSRTEIEDPDLAGDLELYFSAVVMQQLQARGLVRSDEPEILINVSVNVEDVSRAPVQGRNCPRYEDYNSRRRADGYTGEGRRPMCIYTEGSIEIDMRDVGQNHTVWEGVSRVRLDKDDRGIALLRSVANDVATMFEEFPVGERLARRESTRTAGGGAGYLRPLPQIPKPVSERVDR